MLATMSTISHRPHVSLKHTESCITGRSEAVHRLQIFVCTEIVWYHAEALKHGFQNASARSFRIQAKGRCSSETLKLMATYCRLIPTQGNSSSHSFLHSFDTLRSFYLQAYSHLQAC